MNYGKNTARDAISIDLTIANGAAISAAFNFGAYAGGCVLVLSAWTDANIGFQVCATQTGTFAILRDDAGTPIQVSGIATGAARAYALPAKLTGMWLKLWSKSTTSATETDTNQGAERALTVILKS